MRRFLAALLVASGCGTPSPVKVPAAVAVRFDPTLGTEPAGASRWLAFPFPADHRRTARGTLRFRDFPNPDGLLLIDQYLAVAEAELDGASIAGPVHMAFTGPLDPASLPSAPGAFVEPGAPIQLVDLTPSSPEYGRRRPLRWELRTVEGRYAPANSLAVAPAWGVPLRPQTTYALLLTDRVRATDGRPLVAPPLLGVLLGDPAASGEATKGLPAALLDELGREYGALRSLLAREGTPSSRIVAATVFTTQEATAVLRAIHDRLQSAPPPPPVAQEAWRRPRGAKEGRLYAVDSFRWNSHDETSFVILEGRYSSPNYQSGEVPYTQSGGGLVWRDGAPQPVRWEELRFVLTIPREPPKDGDCYPIVEFSHGTGGSAYSLVTKDVGGRLAARGLAAISIDQPLHGPRGEGRSFDLNLTTFNYLNLDSARTLLRQSAIDQIVLTRLVRESLRVGAAVSPTGAPICFDPNRVSFFGHSQGGITGALAAAVERNVSAWVISGTGGGATITMLERKEPLDVGRLVSQLLRLDDSEPLTELHPIATLVQSLVEVTDPLAYAPQWRRPRDRGSPPSLLVTSGEHDVATPHRTAAAMAVAGGIPVVAPVAIPIPAYTWTGLAPVDAPVGGQANRSASGFLQYTNDVPGEPDFDAHSLIFHRPEAIHASMRFFESAAAGAPVIERVPGADAR